ncbi:MAG TPA: hypothetical protein VGL22_01230 [Terracidiphilus sp.]|jgi:hypothetical protein
MESSESRAAQLHFGAHGEYQWIVAEASLHEVLKEVPEAVLGRHIAVTSADSGPLALAERDTARGWSSRGGIAYSPMVERAEDLPCQSCFHEWYVFREPRDLGILVDPKVSLWVSEIARGRVHVFVNYSFGFSLHSSECAAVTEIFWEQMEWIRPESYIADGDQLTVVTRNERLIAGVVRALQRD